MGQAVIPGIQKPPQHRVQSHHFEIGAAHHARADLAWLTQSDHAEADGGEIAECAKRFGALLQIADFRYRERRILDTKARGALANIDQAVFIAVGQRPQQYAPHQRKNGRVRSNAQRQCPRITVSVNPLVRTSDRAANLMSFRNVMASLA